MDEKRKARQSCSLLGELRTGKTVACEAYTLRNKPKQEGRQTPTVPVVYIMPPSKCGAKDLFKEITEYLRYRAVKRTVSDFRSRAMEVLKGCEVEMLIIDEADRLIIGSRQEKSAESKVSTTIPARGGFKGQNASREKSYSY